MRKLNFVNCYYLASSFHWFPLPNQKISLPIFSVLKNPIFHSNNNWKCISFGEFLHTYSIQLRNIIRWQYLCFFLHLSSFVKKLKNEELLRSGGKTALLCSLTHCWRQELSLYYLQQNISLYRDLSREANACFWTIPIIINCKWRGW